jgi:hypothetical protein
MFGELLRIRYSSRLFRLQTAEDVQARVAFWNTGPDQLPGLIVMSISDSLDPDLDREHASIVVLVNANDEAQAFTAGEFATKKLVLHRVQRESADAVVKTSQFDPSTGTFTIPARTTAVFVEYELPQVRIGHLVNDVQALVSAGSLNGGQGNSLITKLESAIQALDRSNRVAAINMLVAFVNEVNALIRGGVLTSEEASPLINTARDIIWQIRAGA